MRDSKIVDLYWNKDEQAIAQTQEKYGHYCYSIAYHIIFDHEDAKEIENDTYLKAWNAMPPHRPNMLSTFLGKITRRLSLNRLREKDALKRGNGEVALSFEELENVIGQDSKKESELTEILNTFLETLPKEERKVFVCRYWYFDSIEEIAHDFNFSQSKVKMMLKRTRDKLSKTLMKEGYAA